MGKLPDLPLDVQELLMRCQSMTPKEFGVHCRLLFHSWAEGGHLDQDERKLRILAGLSGDKHAKVTLTEVLIKWSCDERTIRHDIIVDCWSKAHRKKESYSIRGSKGGVKKAVSAKAQATLSFPGAKDVQPRTRPKPAKKETSQDAIEIGDAYRTIRPDGIAAGMKNIETWLNDGKTKAEMLQAVEHYRPVAETREINYRKKLSNFFGRNEPEWLDWIDVPPVPPVVSEKNKEIMGFSSKKFAGLE